MGEITHVPAEVWKKGKGPEHRFKHPLRRAEGEVMPLGDFGAFLREVLDDPDYEKAADEASAVAELLADIERLKATADSEDSLIHLLDLKASLEKKMVALNEAWPKLRAKLARLESYARRLAATRGHTLEEDEEVAAASATGGE